MRTTYSFSRLRTHSSCWPHKGEPMDVEQLILSMHRDLGDKVDAGFKDVIEKFQKHEVEDEKRFGHVAGEMRELQNPRTTLRWFIGVVVVALLGGVVVHVINHRT